MKIGEGGTMILKWLKGKRIGSISQWCYPMTANCLKCKTSFGLVEGHRTVITDNYYMIALCVECWREIERPMERVPYYLQLYHKSHKYGNEYGQKHLLEFDEIRLAVLKEEYKTPLQFRGERRENNYGEW